MPRERHHARAHQAILKFGRHSRLLRQQALCLVGYGLQQVFQAAQVVRRFGKRARQLLDIRIAIQLQRIEIAYQDRVLMAVHDLRFGFQFQLAQLFTQAGDRLLELFDMKLERGHLLVEPRVIDADFAGCVQQVLEQVGIDARKFLLRFGASQRTHLRGRSGRCCRLDDQFGLRFGLGLRFAFDLLLCVGRLLRFLLLAWMRRLLVDNFARLPSLDCVVRGFFDLGR